MSFDIRILGANSAVPNKDRFPTAQCVSIHNHNILIDCGEGAQINISHYKIKRNKIKTILISHLHGDHVYGLPGLLNSFNLNGRTEAIQIYGPTGIRGYLESVFQYTYVTLRYELTITELDQTDKAIIQDENSYSIYAFPMIHRVPTYGYLIKEKEQPLNIDPSAIQKYGLSIPQIKDVKAGTDITLTDGRTIPNADMTLPIKNSRSYGYCSDTIYDEQLVSHIQRVDLLYHEATYLHELKKQANERKHATAKEAALIAKAANVRQLIIGHYSSRYDDLQPLEDEAKAVFPETFIARQGDLFSIDFR